MKLLCCAEPLTHVRPFATPWTVARQAPLSMGFPREEYWSGLPFPFAGDLPDPGMVLSSLMSLALAGGFVTTSALGSPRGGKWKMPHQGRRERKAAQRRTPSLQQTLALGSIIAHPHKQSLPHHRGCNFPPALQTPSLLVRWPSPWRHLEPWPLPLLPTHLGSSRARASAAPTYLSAHSSL